MPGPRPKVEGVMANLVAKERVNGQDVCACEVGHMNIVAHRGPVSRRVIVTELANRRCESKRDPYDIRDEV